MSKIIKETCHAIWEGLQGEYLKVPQTAEEWSKIADDFETEWNFPNCLGALDGKHIITECPKNGGSAYYNYKNFHSIVLLAVCDAKYCFNLVDVGSYGRESDAAILSEFVFGKLFEGGPSGLNLPLPRLVGNSSLPYVLVGDEIFPLKPWLINRIQEETWTNQSEFTTTGSQEPGEQLRTLMEFCQPGGVFLECQFVQMWKQWS